MLEVIYQTLKKHGTELRRLSYLYVLRTKYTVAKVKTVWNVATDFGGGGNFYLWNDRIKIYTYSTIPLHYIAP